MTDWTFVSDDEWTDDERAAVDAIVPMLDEMDAGVVTTSGYTDANALTSLNGVALVEVPDSEPILVGTVVRIHAEDEGRAQMIQAWRYRS